MVLSLGRVGALRAWRGRGRSTDGGGGRSIRVEDSKRIRAGD